MNYIHLSKLLSKALRHDPSILNLKLNDYGGIDIFILLNELRKKEAFKDIEEQDLYEMINHINKKRFVIENNKMRALYGHSIEVKQLNPAIIPPNILYHGTNFNAYQQILKEGIKSMKRQFVHLSSDVETANMVALRTTKKPIILKINALQAYEDGIVFYYANDNTYLCEYLDPKYLINE